MPISRLDVIAKPNTPKLLETESADVLKTRSNDLFRRCYIIETRSLTETGILTFLGIFDNMNTSFVNLNKFSYNLYYVFLGKRKNCLKSVFIFFHSNFIVIFPLTDFSFV